MRSAAVGTEGQEGRGSMPFSSEYERLMGIVQDMANRYGRGAVHVCMLHV